jgi:type III restriction enzyme
MEYGPDSVAETAHFVLMVEIKSSKELTSPDVTAKASVGAFWCKRASDPAASVGGKPWRYLLISLERVTEDKRLADFFAFEQKAVS